MSIVLQIISTAILVEDRLFIYLLICLKREKMFQFEYQQAVSLKSSLHMLQMIWYVTSLLCRIHYQGTFSLSLKMEIIQGTPDFAEKISELRSMRAHQHVSCNYIIDNNSMTIALSGHLLGYSKDSKIVDMSRDYLFTRHL